MNKAHMKALLLIIALNCASPLTAEDTVEWSRVEFFCPWAYGVEGKIPTELSAFPYGDGTPISQWDTAWIAASPAGKAYLLLGSKLKNKVVYARFINSFDDKSETVVVSVKYGCFSRKWTMKAVAASIDTFSYDWTGMPVYWPNMAVQNADATWNGSGQEPNVPKQTSKELPPSNPSP